MKSTPKRTELLSSAQLQEQVDQLLTSHDLCKLFDITPMTLHTWRKDKGLPAIEIRGGDVDIRPAIRFHPDDVREWARLKGMVLRNNAAAKRTRLAA